MAQDYKNLEILLINDGSKDGSALICEQLKHQDSRVRVIHKRQNEGLGAARNTSIDVATGEYIVFVDADDWIDPNHVSDLYDLMQRTGSDVAISNFTQYYEDTGRYNLHIGPEDYYEAVYSPEEWFNYQYGVGHNISLCFTVPWSKCIENPCLNIYCIRQMVLVKMIVQPGKPISLPIKLHTCIAQV